MLRSAFSFSRFRFLLLFLFQSVVSRSFCDRAQRWGKTQKVKLVLVRDVLIHHIKNQKKILLYSVDASARANLEDAAAAPPPPEITVWGWADRYFWWGLALFPREGSFS